MKKTIPYILFLTIISIVITYVMPFNIINAEQSLNYGKEALTPNNPVYVVPDGQNYRGYILTSGSGYLYGYYDYQNYFRGGIYSLNTFSAHPSNNQGYTYSVDNFRVNDTYYYTVYDLSANNTTGNLYFNPTYPQYTQNHLDIPSAGDYLFDFLGPEAFEGTTKYNANQSFLSWTVGSNPYTITCSSDCYVVGTNRSSTFAVYIFVDDPNSTIEITRSSDNIRPTLNHYVYRGIDLYYYAITQWSYSPSNYTYGWKTNVFTQPDNSLGLHLAYNIYLYDTYEEPNPMVYGNIKDLGYYTRFINNQQSSSYVQRMTKDVITWNPHIDDIGNRIDNGEYQVQIQAVGIEYSELSYNSLMSLDVNDMLALGEPVDIATVDVRNGNLELTWGDVIDALSDQNIVLITSSIFAPVYQNDYWIKQGWYYKVRLINETEEYYGNWQTVYQLTAFDPQPSQNVIDYYINDNNTYPNQDVEQIINNINVNNNTTNNWYTNETPIGYTGTNKPWYEVLLEKIVDLIGLITSLVGGIFNSTIEALAELISNLGVNILEFFQNIINTITTNNESIDLTLPEFNLDSDSLDALGEFKELTNAYTDIFINSGLWFVIVVPLVIFLLRVVF